MIKYMIQSMQLAIAHVPVTQFERVQVRFSIRYLIRYMIKYMIQSMQLAIAHVPVTV